MIVVYLYNYPELQGLFLAITYFLFWVYVFLKNPIKNKIFKIFFTVLESEMCLLHILYFFAIACGIDGDKPSEVHLTSWILRLIMTQMVTYAVFSGIFFINFVKELLSNKKKKRKHQIVPADSQFLEFKNKTNKALAKSEFSIHHRV